MAIPRPLYLTLRYLSTTTRPPSHHRFPSPNSLIGGCNSKEAEAEAKLAQMRKHYNLLVLRRDYVKHVRQVRMKTLMEVELARIEMLRIEEAKVEAVRMQAEQRKKIKADADRARREKRRAAEREAQQTLLKQKAEKLEKLKKKEMLREEKKKEKSG